MKNYLLATLIAFCFIIPVNLNAENQNPILTKLNQYKEQGYKVTGPVQYLGRDNKSIKFYNKDTVSYSTLDIINETGISWLVVKYDFVYLISKNKHIVLLYLRKEGGNNV